MLSAREHATRGNTKVPRVRGLMIAQGYTANANRVRNSLETVTDPQMEFKTWERVIDETERMHLGWLEVSRLRGREPETVATAAAAPAAEPAQPGAGAPAAPAASAGSDGALDPGGGEVNAPA
jgi:hypothetical protein